MKYESHGHLWNFDDRGGERSLPEPEAACVHCSQTWHQFQCVPSKCAPRPVFTPKAENAPESKLEAIPGIRRVNGHEWIEASPGTVTIGEPCRKCQIKYGTPDAVWTCTGSTASVEVPIKKREDGDKYTEDMIRKHLAKIEAVKAVGFGITEAQAWVHFASATIAVASEINGMQLSSAAAFVADELLKEFRKRFPS